MKDPETILIDGGMTFRTRKDYLDFLREREVELDPERNWAKTGYLEEKLNSKLIRVDMPCRENAKYEEWRITFDKYISKLPEQIILVGFSLGGTFLAKYLSEHDISKEVISTYLIAPPFDSEMPEEDLAAGFKPGEDLSKLEENTEKLELFFSEKDDVVPVKHAEKFQKYLSDAEIELYNKNSHFQVKKFPEIVEKINQDLKNHRAGEE
ncbi:MAG: alpha/beta hydrolase [Candidatus Nanosalina sp.]